MAEDKRQHEIIRVQKKKHNFFICHTGFLDDERLSFKAKGILAYVLSKPDNWKVVIKDLMNHAKDGRDSIYAGLKELKGLGYYSKEPIRNERGVILYYEGVIYEDPSENVGNNQLPEKPETDNPETAYPYTAKPERNYIYKSDIDLSNNDKQQTPQSIHTEQEATTAKTDVVVSVLPKKSKRPKGTAPDVSCLSFIVELTDMDRLNILKKVGNDVLHIQQAYDLAKQQGGIDNLVGFIIWAVVEIREGRIKPNVKLPRQTVNRFINFDQRDIDFKELERLELEQLKEGMRKEKEPEEKFENCFANL